uniref:Cystatin domain-containing protein n=1 Tax=Scleropages formosus TaxID=113540 RepID=A0A8C9RNV1_SCLFO
MSSTFRVLWALVSLAALSASAPLSPGAVEDANRDDPELEACAAFALRTFNHFNKDPHLYVITKITSARKAVSPALIKYTISYSALGDHGLERYFRIRNVMAFLIWDLCWIKSSCLK